MSLRLDWRGGEVLKRLREAQRQAVEQTAARAADRARMHHPGWQTRTGAAEASIRGEPAEESEAGARAQLVMDVPYGVFLERRDETLERAAEEEGARLAERIREEIR